MALLTVDEARDELGRSAITLVETLARWPDRLPALLAGSGTLQGLNVDARRAVRVYRAVIREIRAGGHGDVVDEQVEGAPAYAGVAAA